MINYSIHSQLAPIVESVTGQDLEASFYQSKMLNAEVSSKEIVMESIDGQAIEATFYIDDLEYFLDNTEIIGDAS